jgi:serpin B
MPRLIHYTALPSPPIAAFIGIFCCIVLCSRQEDTATKPDNRDLKNSAATFIYNAIPENPRAVISPAYTAAVNTFSINLLEKICTGETFRNKNIVVSPFCVSRNLALITEAATSDSKRELLSVLGGQPALDDATSALSDLLYADNSVILQIADAAWVDSARYTLLPSFREIANKKYGTEVAGLDFSDAQASASTINKWVAANTANRITDVVKTEYIKPITALLLTSAIYFEADWASPFDITKTEPAQFFAPAGPVEVPMMTSSYIHRTRKTGEYESAKLYYGTNGNNFFYLDIYMPVGVSMETFITEKCAAALGNQDSAGYGCLKMPKFFFENEIDLEPVLRAMGINAPFNADKREITGMAFNKLTNDSGLYIDIITQKAGIRTDEEGTIAYAVTVSALGGPTSAGPESPDVTLDKPFVYFIRAGATGLILFAGIVNNPNEG